MHTHPQLIRLLLQSSAGDGCHRLQAGGQVPQSCLKLRLAAQDVPHQHAAQGVRHYRHCPLHDGKVSAMAPLCNYGSLCHETAGMS